MIILQLLHFFLPVNVLGRAETMRHVTHSCRGGWCHRAEQWTHSDPAGEASQSTAGSSGGYARSIEFIGNGMTIISPCVVNYMFN